MNKIIRIFMLVIFLCTACKDASISFSVSPAIDKVEQARPAPIGFQAQLDAAIPEMLTRYRVPGAAIGLIRNGEVMWVKGYGLADLTTGVEISANTIFRVASISKPVTAWGIMHLVEKGEVDLQEPVENYLTRWHFPPSNYDVNEVTPYRLLSHTAGTNIHGYGRRWMNEPIPTLEESLYGGVDGTEGVQIVQKPGSGYMYSGGGYTVLQLLIEEVTGESFEYYMQSEVLDPLGMVNSSFQATQDILSRMATAYDEDLHPITQRRFTEQAAAGLYATADDLARFLAAGLPGPDGEAAGRSVLKPETLYLMYTPADESAGQYGLGYQTYFDGVQWVYHGGDNPGWESTFTIIPSLGEGFLCLTNSDGGEEFNADITSMWVKWLAEQY